MTSGFSMRHRAVVWLLKTEEGSGEKQPKQKYKCRLVQWWFFQPALTLSGESTLLSTESLYFPTPRLQKARFPNRTSTYDHTHWKVRRPVRSALVKPVRARLVVGSVTTSESLVLYVYFVFFCSISRSLFTLITFSSTKVLYRSPVFSPFLLTVNDAGFWCSSGQRRSW
ncbi:hypothetical protein VTK56DRAFT_3951 [Thermocarpiscus australiensis]